MTIARVLRYLKQGKIGSTSVSTTRQPSSTHHPSLDLVILHCRRYYQEGIYFFQPWIQTICTLERQTPFGRDWISITPEKVQGTLTFVGSNPGRWWDLSMVSQLAQNEGHLSNGGKFVAWVRQIEQGQWHQMVWWVLVIPTLASQVNANRSAPDGEPTASAAREIMITYYVRRCRLSVKFKGLKTTLFLAKDD
jgi:hypothetical protein